ncbi:hypothetical protein P7C70_g6830, partial [Phenoliferia sp. Uapishka_3]
MPSSSSIFSSRRDGHSSEVETASSSHRRSQHSPRRGESRNRSRSPPRLSSSSMPAGWYDKMLNLELENRDLKRRLARREGPGTGSGHSRGHYSRSPSRSPKKSPKRRGDIKPIKKILHAPEPTQDDIDFPVGVSIAEANEQAAVYWSNLKVEEVTRSDGFPMDLWSTMSTNPTYLDVTYKYDKLPPYLFTPAGTVMKGFPNPCADYAALHIIAGAVIDNLFVLGPLPRDQPHLDLMGLMFEHLIPAARNLTPGQRKSRAIANRLAPPHYTLAATLATAMVVKYMGYHKEKHRKARLHCLERAETIMANGQRPRKPVVRTVKPDPTYEYLRDESYLSASEAILYGHPTCSTRTDCPITSAPTLTAKPDQCEESQLRQGTPGNGADQSQSEDDGPNATHQRSSSTLAGSPHVASQARKSHEEEEGFEGSAGHESRQAGSVDVATAPAKAKPMPPVQAHSNGFVDLDETVQDVMQAAKDGGAAVNKSPPKKKAKARRKKGSKVNDDLEDSDGDKSDAEPRPPNYSPNDPKNKPKKKTKKQEADAKRMATLTAAKKAKAHGLAIKSKAATEAAESSDPEAVGGNGSDGDAPTEVDEDEDEEDLPIVKPNAKAKARVRKDTAVVAPVKARSAVAGKRASRTDDAEQELEPELPPLKRMRTLDGLAVVPIEGARTSRHRQVAVGQPTGEFNQSYWDGVEKSQPLLDEWCLRLGINQVKALASRHGQGITKAPAKRSYLADLCAIAQRKQRKQLDPKYDVHLPSP